MANVEAWQVVKIHDKVVREERRCDDCGRRRLTTPLTLLRGKDTRIDYLCNECLCATPPWAERKAR